MAMAESFTTKNFNVSEGASRNTLQLTCTLPDCKWFEIYCPSAKLFTMVKAAIDHSVQDHQIMPPAITKD